MIKLCITLQQSLFQVNLSPERDQTLFTPLSKWKPAHLENGLFRLPEGWHTQDSAVSPFLPLHADGSYRVSNGKDTALVLLRRVEREKLLSVNALMRSRITLGRAHENDISYRDGFLSAYHGILSIGGNGQTVYEDASTNGTYLNGQLLHRSAQTLRFGDRLDFAPLLHLIYEGASLRITYPAEHCQLQLDLQPAVSADTARITAFAADIGKLLHLQLPKANYEAAALREQFLRQLSPEEAQLLPTEPQLALLARDGTAERSPAWLLADGMQFLLS